ncbi:MAG: hypothetical protein JXM70_24035 [Pirellulales bacterium]|nr:hypothetical protein [Pirellulales bacterium]
MIEFWASLGFSLFLLLAAAMLMGWHLKTWKTASEKIEDAKVLDYHWRQFRRRMQCSAMLVLLALAIFVGQWITSPPWLVILFWCGTLLIVLWLSLLAVADIIMTIHHFQGLRADCLIQQAKLKAEANRIKSVGGNGRPKDEKPLGE